jgi:hypothetical protein
MLRRPIRAFVALFAGLVMSLSAPALALGHGHAHHELHEHSAETHHGGAGAVKLATMGEDGRHDAHEHAVVDPRLLSRLAQLMPALTAPRVTLDGFDAMSTRVSVAPPVPCESPPDPISARPQQPRAPPAFLIS